MARLEDRIEKAALAIQQESIVRAGATRTCSKSPEDKKNTPPNSSSLEKVGRQPTEANLNNLCNTLCNEELSSGLARVAEITISGRHSI